MIRLDLFRQHPDLAETDAVLIVAGAALGVQRTHLGVAERLELFESFLERHGRDSTKPRQEVKQDEFGGSTWVREVMMIAEKMRTNKIILIAALLWFASPGLAQESPSPELNLKSISGREIRLSNYKDKVVLINFWATWCPPCRAEIPDLIKLQREYKSRGLQIIGVTYPPQTFAEVRRFVRRTKMNYPVALGNKETRSRFSSSETLPLTIVIGKDGRVRDIIEGILLPEEFGQKIKPLLE